MLSKLQPVKSLNCLIGKLNAKMSIRSVLVVSFVLQIGGTMGLVGYLSFQNGQKAVKKLTIQLENEICDRIEQHINKYLTTPQQIYQINKDAIELGLLKPADLTTTGNYFWKQMQVFSIGQNTFAHPNGEFIGVKRLDNENLTISEITVDRGIGKLYVYHTDERGNRSHLKEVKDYDPRLEAWYANPVKLGKPVWSPISQLSDRPESLSLSSSYPLYDTTDRLVGVIGVDLMLSQISDYLAELAVDQLGKTFILERSGFIIASSTNEPPYTVINGQIKRLLATESQDFLIRVTTQNLIQRFGSLGFIVGKQQIKFTNANVSYLVQVKSWRDRLGLDWLIIVVIPEANLIEQINTNSYITILVWVVTFLITTQFGILIGRWLISHILKLNIPVEKIYIGKSKQPTELGELANSLNSMVKQLQESFAVLEAKQAEMKTLDDELSKMTFALTHNDSHKSNTSSELTDRATFSEIIQQKPAEQLLAAEYNCVVEAQVKQRTQELLLVIERLQIAQQELIEAQKIATQGQQAAEQANRAKSEFLANMSHELRTPLNAILGFTQVMSLDRSLSSEHQQNLAIINRAGEHLLNLINDILEMSKIEAGRTTLNVSSFNLISLLQSLEEMLRCRTAAKNIQLIFEYTPDIPQYVQTDESRLRQVLLNLLGNAIKFTHAGSVTLRVRLGTLRQDFGVSAQSGDATSTRLLRQGYFDKAQYKSVQVSTSQSNAQCIAGDWGHFDKLSASLGTGDTSTRLRRDPSASSGRRRSVERSVHRWGLETRDKEDKENNQYPIPIAPNPQRGPRVPQSLIFEIEDTGAGISPQEIELLFEAFGQTEIGRKSQQGTGLGLAISRKYVQLMGGDITVSSALGLGSKFSFNIQIDVVESSEIQTKQTQHQVIFLAPEQKEYRILVVDDVADNRLLLVKLLTSIGFVVREAANGREAIAQWLEWQPHLIFMDMRMPVMDGYEATRVIKARTNEHGIWGMRHLQEKIDNTSYCPSSSYIYNSAPPNVLALSCPIPRINTVIIALTASAFEEERQQILSAGCDDFIRKPFTQEILLKTVSQYLGVKYINKVENTNTATVERETQIITNEAHILRDLSQMSPEWLGKLRHAAASCSDDLILELIQHLPPDKSQIFQVFKDLANNYQFEKIMELTRTNAE